MSEPTKEPTIEDLLDSLITDKSSDEDIKTVGKIKELTQKLDDERVKALEERHAYRQKYVQAIQNGDFGTAESQPQQPQGPITVEELLHEFETQK